MKTKVTKVSVFEEMFDKEEAADMELRARLMLAIREFAKKNELNQTELAEVLQVSQSRISDLLNGKIDKFSIGMLIKFAMRIGLHIEVSVEAKTAEKKKKKIAGQKAALSGKKAKFA